MFDKLIPWKKKERGDWMVRNEDHPIARLHREFDDLWNRFWDDWKSGDLSHTCPKARSARPSGLRLNLLDR